MGSSRVLKFNDDVKYEDYLYQFFEKISSIDKSRYKLMTDAFKKTIVSLFFSGTSFEIRRFFKFKILDKKERDVRDVLNGRKLRPAIKSFSLLSTGILKDYLNGRRGYEKRKHKQVLPDGTPRKDDMFKEENKRLW